MPCFRAAKADLPLGKKLLQERGSRLRALLVGDLTDDDGGASSSTDPYIAAPVDEWAETRWGTMFRFMLSPGIEGAAKATIDVADSYEEVMVKEANGAQRSANKAELEEFREHGREEARQREEDEKGNEERWERRGEV